MTLRREEIGLASEKSVSLHVHDCYLQAASSDVRATLGSFRLVPDRGLGRVVTIANCDPVTLCGAAVAFCDPEKQYICYGEILRLDGKLVALLFDGLGITDDEESHEFVLVKLNLAASCFINHLASLHSKSFDDMKRVKSLLQGEACESLESGLHVTHDEAAIKTALDSSLNSSSAKTHPFDENQVIAVKAAVTSQSGSDLAAALSRARCAVYGFGRLASTDESCQNVFNTAHENNRRANPALSLSCVRHPGTIVCIESGEHEVVGEIAGIGDKDPTASH
ncbi:hypothetical protein HPB52_003816 [Rhipicephalus sanguineus]|uniref:Uncharacterized protein n=1 Tax=Rhipicephalus sanguineus TaxID=34632 RepID=A0A9D4Q5A3_RHISA|nr:hypothetical protein HPB52_003816 [Rhipicephalus sanguineus]